MSLTPMLKQYFSIKEKHQDKILFFRLGDFYEMFGPDAQKASNILDITLTARNKGTENEIPMCGIPYHAAEMYIAKLTKAGKKVAICEQVSDVNLPGIVKREVVRVVTPGTTLDSSLLDKSENNFLTSIAMKPSRQENLFDKEKVFGLSFVDLTTGEFKSTEIVGQENLITELKRINPAEIILDGLDSLRQPADSQGNDRNEFYPDNTKWYCIFKNVSQFQPPIFFDHAQTLCQHFRVHNLESFGIANLPLAIQAAANLYIYLKDTQKTALNHITHISQYNPTEFMILDEATIRNLDLVYNWQTKSQEGTLLRTLDKTSTAMGGRLLRQWILRPLLNLEAIQKRYEKVDFFYYNHDLRNKLAELLSSILDIERILGRIGCRRANAKDLVGLKNSLETICTIKQILEKENQNFAGLDPLENIIELVNTNITDDPPAIINEGGMIKNSINAELDELRAISGGGKDWIAQFQTEQRKRTGINSLKVKFNRIFGYYIEISNSNLEAAPAEYIRKQTLVNGERFSTPELKEYEEKVLTAEEKITELELKLFYAILAKIIAQAKSIQESAQAVAKLDVIINFARLARENNYVKPKINNDDKINVKDCRHPVVEKLNNIAFIANDIMLDNSTSQLILLTGPNMSGKSVYLRQIALVSLMAQIGSYVPAKEAEIGIVDRIFTRVGASDNIAYGQSTFMVEMQEAANILNNATSKSLVIFDELGRGTSTYDGVSIAWAVMEYLHNQIGAKTIFATHYHELVDLANTLQKAQNYRVAVLEKEDGVIFLHKVIKGGMDKSYGIEVAKLAGLPQELIARANEVLQGLENKKPQENSPQQNTSNKENPKYIELKNKLSQVDLNNMTPMQAFEILNTLIKKFR